MSRGSFGSEVKLAVAMRIEGYWSILIKVAALRFQQMARLMVEAGGAEDLFSRCGGQAIQPTQTSFAMRQVRIEDEGLHVIVQMDPVLPRRLLLFGRSESQHLTFLTIACR